MEKTEKKRSRKWSREQVINEIAKLSDVSAKSVQRTFPSLYGAAARHFGNWGAAIDASGRDYQRVRKRKSKGYWTEARIREQICELEVKHSSGVRRQASDLYNAALRAYGSWKKAIQAAGFDYESLQKGRSREKKN